MSPSARSNRSALSSIGAACGRPGEQFCKRNGKGYFASGRVTFCADRKSPKNCLREGGFRFPPSLRKPIPLKRPSTGGTAVPPIGCTPRGTVTWKVQRRNGPVVDETAGRCGPRAGACSRQFYASGISPGGRATTEPPREGRALGAIALVGAQAYSSNTERQRAARGTVSCLLPAPDGVHRPLMAPP